MPTADEVTGQQRAQWSAAALGWERWGDWFDRNSGNFAGWLCDAARMAPGQTVLDLAKEMKRRDIVAQFEAAIGDRLRLVSACQFAHS